MNKKIASELAIGVILLVAVITGGIFLAQDVRQGLLGGAAEVENKQVVAPIKPVAQPEKKQQAPVNGPEDGKCLAKLYEGEASLRGTYELTTIPGSTKKDWMFKIVKEDIEKLPDPAKEEKNGIISSLLFIEDLTPALAAKLKKATEEKPETITIKGFYLDCEGVSVVSIEPARLALAKYIKKTN